MKRGRVALISLTLLFVCNQACAQAVNDWPMFGRDTSRTSRTQVEVPPNASGYYTTVWSNSGAAIHAPAVVSGGAVYFARKDGKIHRSLTTSNTPFIGWPVSLPNTADIFSSPVLANQRLYVVTHVTSGFSENTRLYCLDALSGAYVWATPGKMTGNSNTAPTVVGDKVMVFCDNGISVFSVSTGALVNTLGVGSLQTPAAVWHGKAYIVNSGMISRYNPVTNTVDTTITVASAQPSPCAISSDGHLYASFDGTLGAYDLNARVLQWTSTVTYPGSIYWNYPLPAISDSLVVVAPNVCAGLLRTTGAVQWSVDASYGTSFGQNSPIIASKTVLVPNSSGILYCFDLNTGAERAHTPNSIVTYGYAPAVVGDSLIFIGYDNGVFAALKGGPPTGTITVKVYNDLNGDGIQQVTQGETGLSGVATHLRGSASRDCTTNSDGICNFTTVPTGTYIVSCDIPTGYSCTTANCSSSVNVQPDGGAYIIMGLHRAPTVTASGCPASASAGQSVPFDVYVARAGTPWAGATVHVRDYSLWPTFYPADLATLVTNSGGHATYTYTIPNYYGVGYVTKLHFVVDASEGWGAAADSCILSPQPILFSVTLDLPTAGASTVLPATFTWHASYSTQATYRLQFSPASNFSSLAYQDSVATTSTSNSIAVPYGSLANGAIYYWRIVAARSGAALLYSGVQSVPISAPPLSAPALASPGDGATVSLVPTLAWNAVSGATSYAVTVASDAALHNPGCSATVTPDMTSWTYSGTPLTPSGTYYWSVNALVSGGSWTGYATARRFVCSGVQPGPAPPAMVAPTNASSVNLPETFAWTTVASAARFWLRVAADSSFASPLWMGYPTPNSTQVPSSIPGMSQGGTYYWAVSSIDAANNIGTRSPAWRFTYSTNALPPLQATLISPADGEHVTSRNVVFSWQATSATQYDLTYSTRSDFAAGSGQTQVLAGLTSNSTTVSLSGGNLTIYWKVAPRNAAGYGPTSAVRSFQYFNPGDAISSIVILRPVGNLTVPNNSTFAAHAQITGTYTGSVSGQWNVDGSSVQSFTLTMSSASGLTLDSRALPTSAVGSHTVQLMLTSPVSQSSAGAGYTVADVVPGAATSAVLTVSPTNLISNGTSAASILVNVVDANGVLVSTDNNRLVALTWSGSHTGSLSAVSGLTSSGTWSTTYLAGPTGSVDNIVVVVAGLPTVQATITTAADPLQVLKQAATAYLSQLGGLSVQFGVFSLPVTSYDISSAQAWVNSATVADTAGLSRLVLVARALRHIYNYDPDAPGRICYGTSGCEPIPIPGAMVTADDAIAGCQSVLGVIIDAADQLERATHTLAGPVTDPLLADALSRILSYVDNYIAVLLDQVHDLDGDTRQTIDDAKSALVSMIQAHIEKKDMGLSAIITGPVIRLPADEIALGAYTRLKTQGVLDGALSASRGAITNSYAQAVQGYAGAISGAINQSCTAAQDYDYLSAQGDMASYIASLTSMAALVPGPQELVVEALSLASRVAALSLYSVGTGHALAGFIDMPSECALSLTGIYGTGSVPALATRPAVLRNHLAGVESTPPRALWTQLMVAQATSGSSYEAQLNAMLAALARSDSTFCHTNFAALLASDNSLGLATHLAGSPLTATSHAAALTIAGFDSTAGALHDAGLSADVARLQFSARLAQYLLATSDPVARQQAIGAGNAALAATSTERSSVQAAVQPLLSTPAVPTLRLLSIALPTSVCQHSVTDIAVTLTNLGAGTTEGTFLELVADSSIHIYGADSVAVRALAPGDTASVAITIIAPDTTVHSALLQFRSGCSNGIGEDRLRKLTIAWCPQTGVVQPTVPPGSLQLDVSPNPGRLGVGMKLAFSLPGPDIAAEVGVFDVTGRKVATLFSGTCSGGSHVSTWRGTTDAGAAVSPGIYVVRISSGSHAVTRRVVILQ